jgi:hypothetical protein
MADSGETLRFDVAKGENPKEEQEPALSAN